MVQAQQEFMRRPERHVLDRLTDDGEGRPEPFGDQGVVEVGDRQIVGQRSRTPPACADIGGNLPMIARN